MRVPEGCSRSRVFHVSSTRQRCPCGEAPQQWRQLRSPDLDIKCGDPKDAADHVSSITAPGDNEHVAPSSSKPGPSSSTMSGGAMIAETAGSSRSVDLQACTPSNDIKTKWASQMQQNYERSLIALSSQILQAVPAPLKWRLALGRMASRIQRPETADVIC